jgi:hypothetical protein
MIRYALVCQKGHGFDGWFRSSDDYDAQRKRRLVSCPSCGTTKVEKAVMAPRVVPSDKAASRRRKGEPKNPSPEVPAPDNTPSLVASAEHREMLQKLRQIRDEVLKKSEYVGPRFAEEARKIHSEDAPERGIYGEATPAEVKSLSEEGIDVFPIPVLPDDKN